MKLSDGVEIPPEELKPFREGLAVAFKFNGIDPELAPVIRSAISSSTSYRMRPRSFWLSGTFPPNVQKGRQGAGLQSKKLR